MSFLGRFKKKSGAVARKSPAPATVTPTHQESEAPASPKKKETPPPTSPTHAVEISNSIFSGLKLSAQVASKEGRESPYLLRSQADSEGADDAPSSFSFLESNPDPESPETEGSLFGFITQKEQEEEEELEQSSFSFLQKSHDTEQKSHDTEEISHDTEQGSHDTTTKHDPRSHDDPPETITEHPLPQIKETIDDTEVSSVKQTPVPKKAPLQNKKKKKRKAVHPGQRSKEDALEGDSISSSSHTSSLDSSPTKKHNTPVIQLVDLDSDGSEVSMVIKDKPPAQDTPEVVPSTEGLDNSTDNTTMEDTLSQTEEPEKVKEFDTGKQDSQSDVPPTRNRESDVPLTEGNSQEEELTEVFTQPNYSVELSDSDKLTVLLEGFESGLAKIRGGQSVTELRFTVSEAVTSAQGQVEKRRLAAVLRSQQSQALAEEDYELAEQLHQQLEGTRLTQEHVIAAAALEGVSQWLVKCQEMDENEISFREDMQSKIAALLDEQTKALAQLDKEHSSLMAKDKMKLQGMEDTLEREKGHIALDREHLERREQVLSDEVHRRAADFISKKTSLEEELTSVKDEIASLEEKLLSLRAQETTIVELITEQQTKIVSIEEELAAEKSQLAEEREVIVVREEQLAIEQEKLVTEKASLAAAHDGLISTREGLASLVNQAQTVTEEFELTVEGLRRASTETEGLLGMEERGRSLLTPSEDLTQLLERVSEQSSKVDSLTSGVLSSQTELSSHRKQLSDLQAQVPQLNDAKKAAVTGRRFKEASRIASELKTIASKMEEVKGEISTTETKLGELNKELSQQSEKLEVLKKEADDQEREEDKTHLTTLLASLDELREVKSRLDTSSFSEVVGRWVELYSLIADNLVVKHAWKMEDFRPVQAEESSQQTPLEEERTPGVGQEEATPSDTAEKIAALEREIEEACTVEDYDKAAELEEKLNKLKQSTGIKTD